MKVQGPTGVAPHQSARPSRTGSGFSVPAGPSAGAGAAAASATATAAAAGPGDVSALMALQGVESVTERRRRALRRGHGLLDGLEALRLTALGEEDDEAALHRLARASREAGADVEDADLAEVLGQIDLRAAVELAKRETRRTAA
jgi:hypothetical protein